MLRTVSITAIALFGISPAFGQVSTPPMTMPADMMKQVEPGVEIREQGPIHEAFAQPGAETRGKGMTAPKEPPPQIEELPPETKPEGANVKWVPGYWSWDEQRKDFTWVSGLWRNTPDGRDWNPGKWNKQANGQYEYTPGFWRPSEASQLPKGLPEPPKSLEAGPNGPAANSDSIWIPGGWELYSGRYVWRPGYWATPNGNMIWEPSQYVLTDDGYSYVPGYWDYPLEQRGLLYAPVGFSRPLWQTPGWRFRPYYAIGVGYGGGYGSGGFYNSLYIGPGMNSYYFGSGLGYGYGGYGYSGVGIGLGGFGGLGFGLSAGIGFGYTPWYSSGIGYYNGLWNHYSWMNRSSPNWQSGIRSSYEARGFVGPSASHWATGISNRTIVVSGANSVNFGRNSGSVVVNPSNLHVNGSPLNGSRNVIQPAHNYVRELNSNYPQSRVVVNSGNFNQGTVHQFQGNSFSQPSFRSISGGSTTIMGSGPRVVYPSGGSSFSGQSGRVMGGFSGHSGGGFSGHSGGGGGGGHGGGHR